ncbi:MAG: hypothetical protein KIT27_05140 [Legionellales bacterium]|nr:hypothetical protein [Legionellales bacterium]
MAASEAKMRTDAYTSAEASVILIISLGLRQSFVNAIFETDEDRSYFLIRLPIHVGFDADTVITEQVTPEVKKLLTILQGEMSRAELMVALGLKDEKHFREYYQQTAIL